METSPPISESEHTEAKTETFQRVLSIDVGIKNLSFCYFDTSPQSTRVLRWENLRVTEDNCKTIKLDKLTDSMLSTLSDTFDHEFEADVVLIENQPMLKNGMMKTMAVIIYTYFNMSKLQFGNIKEVRFISATNKLKCKRGADMSKETYKDRKQSSIELVTRYVPFIAESFKDWFAGLKKKDDPADCCLQGIYYIEHIMKHTI